MRSPPPGSCARTRRGPTWELFETRGRDLRRGALRRVWSRPSDARTGRADERRRRPGTTKMDGGSLRRRRRRARRDANDTVESEIRCLVFFTFTHDDVAYVRLMGSSFASVPAMAIEGDRGDARDAIVTWDTNARTVLASSIFVARTTSRWLWRIKSCSCGDGAAGAGVRSLALQCCLQTPLARRGARPFNSLASDISNSIRRRGRRRLSRSGAFLGRHLAVGALWDRLDRVRSGFGLDSCMTAALGAHLDVSTRGAAAHRAGRAPFRLTPYLSGSFLYLAGSCCFFAGGVGATGDADGSSRGGLDAAVQRRQRALRRGKRAVRVRRVQGSFARRGPRARARNNRRRRRPPGVQGSPSRRSLSSSWVRTLAVRDDRRDGGRPGVRVGRELAARSAVQGAPPASTSKRRPQVPDEKDGSRGVPARRPPSAPSSAPSATRTIAPIDSSGPCASASSAGPTAHRPRFGSRRGACAVATSLPRTRASSPRPSARASRSEPALTSPRCAATLHLPPFRPSPSPARVPSPRRLFIRCPPRRRAAGARRARLLARARTRREDRRRRRRLRVQRGRRRANRRHLRRRRILSRASALDALAAGAPEGADAIGARGAGAGWRSRCGAESSPSTAARRGAPRARTFRRRRRRRAQRRRGCCRAAALDAVPPDPAVVCSPPSRARPHLERCRRARDCISPGASPRRRAAGVRRRRAASPRPRTATTGRGRARVRSSPVLRLEAALLSSRAPAIGGAQAASLRACDPSAAREVVVRVRSSYRRVGLPGLPRQHGVFAPFIGARARASLPRPRRDETRVERLPNFGRLGLVAADAAAALGERLDAATRGDRRDGAPTRDARERVRRRRRRVVGVRRWSCAAAGFSARVRAVCAGLGGDRRRRVALERGGGAARARERRDFSRASGVC